MGCSNDSVEEVMCRISEPSELPPIGVIQAEEAVVGAKASCTCTDIRSSSVIVRKRRGQACQVPNNAAPYPPPHNATTLTPLSLLHNATIPAHSVPPTRNATVLILLSVSPPHNATTLTPLSPLHNATIITPSVSPPHHATTPTPFEAFSQCIPMSLALKWWEKAREKVCPSPRYIT